MFEDDTDQRYFVVVNDEEQYSIWPQAHPLPIGWEPVGDPAFKSECLAQINTLWTDLRPKSLRDHMNARSASRPPEVGR